MKKSNEIIKCKDCLLFNEQTNYCGFYDNYDRTAEKEACGYEIIQKDYDFMIREQDFDLEYFNENY